MPSQRVEDKAVNQSGTQPVMLLPQCVIIAVLRVVTKAFVLKYGIILSSGDAFTYKPKRPKSEAIARLLFALVEVVLINLLDVIALDNAHADVMA